MNHAFTSVVCSIHKPREAYLPAARNTFVFPGMTGREMATEKGHGEMEPGRWGRKEVGMGRQGVARGMGWGKEVRMGRQGMGRERQGGGKGWLVDIV